MWVSMNTESHRNRSLKMVCWIYIYICVCMYIYIYILIWVFPKIMVPQNHPFVHRVWNHYKPSILGHPIFGNTHIYVYIERERGIIRAGILCRIHLQHHVPLLLMSSLITRLPRNLYRHSRLVEVAFALLSLWRKSITSSPGKNAKRTKK